MKINSSETAIVGKWLLIDGKMTSDENEKRIDWLINNCLVKISVDWSGWEKLYQDTDDNRYWELTYPYGEMQGRGPKSLNVISHDQATEKYKF